VGLLLKEKKKKVASGLDRKKNLAECEKRKGKSKLKNRGEGSFARNARKEEKEFKTGKLSRKMPPGFDR